MGGGPARHATGLCEQGIPDQQAAYLDKADASLEGQHLNQILFGVTRVQLATTEIALLLMPSDKLIPSTEKLRESCANLADQLKT